MKFVIFTVDISKVDDKRAKFEFHKRSAPSVAHKIQYKVFEEFHNLSFGH